MNNSVETYDISNEVATLENTSLRDLEDALYAMVNKPPSSEGDNTFAA